jgi:hypothetical protein
VVARVIADSQYAATLARTAAYAEMGPLAAAAARGQLSAEQIQTAIERAAWRALRQVYADRLEVALPKSLPKPGAAN